MLPGWAYWNGEILPVRALNATPHAAGTVKIKLTRIEAYNRDGVKSITAGDNSVTNRDTYREDYLQPSLAGEFDSYDLAISEGFYDLATRIINSAKMADSGVVPVTDSASYRRIGGVTQLLGVMLNDAGSGFNGEVLSGLPRPSSNIRFPVLGGEASDHIVVTTAGKLFAYTKCAHLYLDHVSYLTSPITGTGHDGHYSTSTNQQI